MAEILVIFPPDKETAAGWIGAALEAAGYSAILEPAAGPDGESIARKAASRAAAVLIWSRPLAAAADLGEWPAGLRRLPNLIEVSTDGIAPQSGDERAVVLLSGWRGQPFHLGWQRVLDELARLGARRAAPARAAPPTAEGRAPGPAAAKAAPGTRGRRLALPAAAALALLGAVGAAAWIVSDAADPPASSGARQAAAAPRAASPPRAAPATVAAPAPPPARLATAAPETAPIALAEPSPPVRTASAPSGEAIRPPPKRRPVAEPPLKRYSKKHSKTMRLFCARSGRSTPQCRTFARSMAADR